MKKLLLLFTLLTAALGSASADEAAYVAGTSTLSTPETQTKIENNNGSVLNTNYTIEGVCSMTIEKKNTSSSSNVNGDLVRWYANDIMHITPAENITITQVVFNCSTANYAKQVGGQDNTVTSTGISTNGSIATWSGSSNNELQFVAKAQVRFSSIIITYSKKALGAVEPAKVTFTPEAGTYTEAQSVELKADGQKEDGSAWPIYYTTNGEEPTEASEQYESPISVESNMTIKAIAVGSKATEVFSAEYIINYPAAEIPVVTCNGVAYENNAIVNVPYLANLTVKSANATSIVKIYDGQDEIFEGTNEYSFCPDRDGVYKFYGVGKGGDSDEFTLTINIVPVNTAASQAVTASYNFSEPATLVTTTGKTFSAETGEDQDNGNTCTTVDGITFENEGIHVTFDVVEGASNPTATRIYYSTSAGIALRVYKNHSLKIEAPNGETLKSIVVSFTQSTTSGITATSWSYSASEDKKTLTWTPNTDNASLSEANFTISGSLRIKSIDVVYEAGTGEAVIAMPLLKVDNMVVEDPESLGEISGRSLTFTAAEGSVIEHQIEGETIAARAISADAWVTTDSNVYTYDVPATLENDITLNIRAKAGDTYSEVRSINIAKDGTITGIEAVAADGAEDEAEYFNLQGIRVANPQGGVFIRRQGAKVAKVAL